MKRLFVLAGLVVFGSGLALAQGQGQAISRSPDDIISERQALMDLQGGIVAAMKAAVDNGWDVKPFTDGAKALVSSSANIPILFPPGTEHGHNTKAKPDVWSDSAGFQKAGNDLHAAAEKLVPLAEANDKAGFKTQFAAIGQACGGCHRPYRER